MIPITTNLYSHGASSGNGWIDDDLRRMVYAIQELQNAVRILDMEVDGLKDFVKYVDETAPELRTAYQVSKRIE